MRLLAIETATAATVVGALGDGIAHNQVVDRARRHTETLAPALVSMLDALGWSVSDLDGIVVDVGPGLFTGLRVGIATAKGLSVATGVGLWPVTSTEVLAETALDAGVTGRIECVVDARRGELFTQGFVLDGATAASHEPLLVETPAALATRLDAIAGHVGAVGELALVPRADVRADVTWHEAVDVPSALSATRLAQRRAAAGAAPADHRAVHPLYVREPDAVANFARRGGA